MTKACPFYIDSATSKKLSPQLLALVHHTVPFTKMTKLDVEYRRLLRMVVGPPADTNWASDSALELQRTTNTRTTCLHLGNSVGKILYLESFDNWIVEAFEYGHWMRFKEDFVFFTLYIS